MTLLRIAATLERGSPEQVSACIPIALHLQGKENLTEADVQQALCQFPLLKRHHISPLHLPNLVKKIVRTCFMSQRPSNRAMDPIGHVLNKAWPMRCSVRNFSDIISGYILREVPVYRFICTVMHACMCGLYPTAKVKAALPLQLLLHKYYIFDRIPQQHLCRWVQQQTGNHTTVFIAVKEYIAYAVSMVPGLAHVLQENYGWQSFVQSVTAQADAVRAQLNMHVHSPERMFGHAQQAMMAVKGFKCPPAVSNEIVLCEAIHAVVRAQCVPSINVYHSPLRVKLYKVMFPALAAGVPIDAIARCLRVPRYFTDIVSDIIVARPQQQPLLWRKLRSMKCTDDSDALFIHEFVTAWYMSLRIGTHDLPDHVKAKQLACDTDRSTAFYACTCCKQLRAFVVEEGRAANNAWARGHQKVLLDDCTGILYCGRRVEKVSSQSRRLQLPNESGRSYWKAQQSLMCRYCPLLRIELLGKILSFYGKLYVLCPQCMCVMILTSTQYYSDAFCCVNCRYKTIATSPSTCFHCQCTDVELSPLSLADECVSVCAGCRRWWMGNTTLVQKLTRVVAHQAINERWPANRAEVYCASL